ncbi:MAG TPA: TolC family protein [Polyangiales bacterium]|nr:TolC family protein [Polyangiales bacterium]
MTYWRAALLMWWIGGCAWVRPVELRPKLSAPATYVSAYRSVEEKPRSAGAEEGEAPAQESKPGARPAVVVPDGGPWWTAFADSALDDAVQEAIRNNYLIRDLRTLIYENQLIPEMPNGILWPLQIEVPATLARTTDPVAPSSGGRGSVANNTAADVGISASYQLDVFGHLDIKRRTFEDLIEQQTQNTERLAQSLALQVTQLWFEILEQRAQLQLLERQVKYNQELLALVRARFEQHLTTRLVVLQQEQQLLDTQARVPLLHAQLALLDSRLNNVLGRAPNSRKALVPHERELPDLPPSPSIGRPAELLDKSPDLRFAQSRVAEVQHLMSENLTSWLPTIDVFGGFGVRTFNFSQPFMLAAAGVRLTWPIFDGAQRITLAKQLDLTLERRTGQYRSAFNEAIQRVQDALLQEQKQTAHVITLRSEVELGERVLSEARELFERGVSDYLPVLAALSNLSNLERASLQARRQLLSYRTQLYFALGGTWSKAATVRDPRGENHE